MKVGPDIALVASLMGDPARANMLTALMAGQALTAGELAREAGVTAQTASSHLAKLAQGGLVSARRQGRHSYFALSGADVAAVVEGLTCLAARAGHQRARPGPSDPALRRARVCYDHLAGEQGVVMLEGLIARGRMSSQADELTLTPAGEALMIELGIDLLALRQARRPLCRSCLDWSVRRSHLGGALGAALLQRLYGLGWAGRAGSTRVVDFTSFGEAEFARMLGAAG